jgi:uncharacterized protein YpuA (DUF1002 family)
MKRLCLLLIPVLLFGATFAQTQPQRVISFGKDLTAEEKQAVVKDFPLPTDVKLTEIKTLTVTNQEEWQLLKGLVSDEEIGTKAISSVFIEKRESGTGLEIETKNLSLVTPHMIANALATAGVKDAKVVAAAPSLVSGTAALTGIYKSFEELTGTVLTLEAKRTAAEELIKTGNLGEAIGKERAATLLERTKERVIQEKTTDKVEIIKVVEKSAQEQNITLTETQKQEMADLLLKIKQLNIDLSSLQNQLKNFRETADEKAPAEETEPGSLFDRIISFIRSLVDQLFSFVGKILRF